MRSWYQAKTPEQRKAWIAKRDKERVREADRQRSKEPHRIAAITANTRRWRSENPEKYAAHRVVAEAIRRGEIEKKPCEDCGSPRVHAHHDDYAKPLQVRWLCALHHAAHR